MSLYIASSLEIVRESKLKRFSKRYQKSYKYNETGQRNCKATRYANIFVRFGGSSAWTTHASRLVPIMVSRADFRPITIAFFRRGNNREDTIFLPIMIVIIFLYRLWYYLYTALKRRNWEIDYVITGRDKKVLQTLLQRNVNRVDSRD